MNEILNANPRESYCWVRVLRMQDDATVPFKKTWVEPHDLGVLHGPRPPGRIASADAAKGKRGEGGGGGGGSTVTWQAHPDYFGRSDADTVFDYGPVFDSVDEATRWILEPDGLQWDREALNRFLMGVAWNLGVTDAKDDCHPLVEHKDLKHDSDIPGNSRFPDTAWSPAAAILHKHEQPPNGLLFDPQLLAKTKCPDISTFDTSTDCQAVLTAAARRSERDGVIRLQAQGGGQAILPVLSVIGVNPDHPISEEWKHLIADLAESVEPAIFYAKRIHGRQRPDQFCGSTVNPYFKQNHPLPNGGALPHRLYPGHPSYPSGHATVAYLWAFLVGHFKPNYRAQLERAARRVSQNRVVAGLHFPTDTDGGREFAKAISAEIIAGTTGPSRTFLSRLQGVLGTLPDTPTDV